MSDDTLNDLVSALAPCEGGLTVSVSDNWKQGRTNYGGITAALLLETALRAVPDLPPLRSAMIGFTAPVTEPAVYSAEVLRRGRNISTLEARARIGDQVVGTGNFSFGAAQDSAISVARPAPDAPPPADCDDFIPPQAIPFVPGFHKNFEMLRIEGDLPMSGSKRGYLRGWARHRDPASRGGIVSMICMGDILPPAVFPLFPRLGPNSSVTWMFNVLDPDPQTEDGWWQVNSEVTAAGDGYSSQVMRMWNSDGKLVADGMQSVIVFV